MYTSSVLPQTRICRFPRQNIVSWWRAHYSACSPFLHYCFYCCLCTVSHTIIAYLYFINFNMEFYNGYGVEEDEEDLKFWSKTCLKGLWTRALVYNIRCISTNKCFSLFAAPCTMLQRSEMSSAFNHCCKNQNQSLQFSGYVSLADNIDIWTCDLFVRYLE